MHLWLWFIAIFFFPPPINRPFDWLFHQAGFNLFRRVSRKTLLKNKKFSFFNFFFFFSVTCQFISLVVVLKSIRNGATVNSPEKNREKKMMLKSACQEMKEGAWRDEGWHIYDDEESGESECNSIATFISNLINSQHSTQSLTLRET